jgi:hypothetical protein
MRDVASAATAPRWRRCRTAGAGHAIQHQHRRAGQNRKYTHDPQATSSPATVREFMEQLRRRRADVTRGGRAHWPGL